MIVQDGAAKLPKTILTKNRRFRLELMFIERRRGSHNLKSGTRFHHIDDGAVFHFLGLRFRAEIKIKIRAIRHGEDFASLRPHQDNRRFLG